MGILDRIQERARKITPQARTALLAAAAGRVTPVYEANWFGDHYTEVGRSVEVGWAYALGEPVDAAELARLLAVVEDLVQFYYEDDTRSDLLARVVTVVLRVLQSMASDETAAVLATARGTLTVIDAASSAEADGHAHLPRSARPNAAVPEERAWVEAAFALAEAWTGPIRRDMFDSLGGHPPRWFTAWLARREL